MVCVCRGVRWCLKVALFGMVRPWLYCSEELNVACAVACGRRVE